MITGTVKFYFTPRDACYLRGYQQRTRAGWSPLAPSVSIADVNEIRALCGDDGVKALFDGCRAGTVAVRFGVDLSAEIVEREQR